MNNHDHLPTAAFIYYAEPVDLASGPSRDGYRIVRALGDIGFTCYRAATTWTGGIFNPALVEHLNREALYASNAVIADASTGSPSVGVWMEVEAATTRGIPAIVLVDPTRPRSVSLQANPLVTFAETWGDAVALANRAAQTHWAHHGRKVEPPRLKFTMALGTDTPRQAFGDDAGFDLVTAVDTEIPARSFVDVPTTVTGIQCPPGTWALVTGRSSTIRKRGLLIPSGVIDCGWRGPLMAGAYNLSDETVTVRAGERIAQVILMSNQTERVQIERVEKLDPHDRGLNGFGSSGGHGDGASLAVTTAAPADSTPYRWDGPATPAELPWASEGERLQALAKGWNAADAGQWSEEQARQL